MSPFWLPIESSLFYSSSRTDYAALRGLKPSAQCRKTPEFAFKMPWERLEELVAGAYKRAGFEEVTLTPRSGDHGRDVIATK
jgi:HJR/Mrr/RecB family endonuclease